MSNPPEEANPSRSIVGHYSGLVLPDGDDQRPFVYVNMVSSVDGKSTVDGSERGLGSADDQRMMRELRVHADAVMNGANTLRISGSTPRVRAPELQAQRKERGLAPQPLGVIVTRSGDLPLDGPFFTSTDFDAAVFVTETTPADRRAAIAATGRHLVVIPDGPDNAADVVHILRRDFGVRRLLCEGGATLNAALVRVEVLDQLFITLAPWIAGGTKSLTTFEGVTFHRDTMPSLRLLQQLHDEATGELFLRYAVSYRHPAPVQAGQ